jgi:hypothetical protein
MKHTPVNGSGTGDVAAKAGRVGIGELGKPGVYIYSEQVLGFYYHHIYGMRV